MGVSSLHGSLPYARNAASPEWASQMAEPGIALVNLVLVLR